MITTCCYVDDQIAYASNIEDGRILANQIRRINRSGGFPTHKFLSNCPAILEDFKDEEKADSRTQKVLGITWKTERDVLVYNFLNETAVKWKPRR